MTIKAHEFELKEPITLVGGKEGPKTVPSLVFRYPHAGDTMSMPQPFRVISSPGDKHEIEMDRPALQQWMLKLSTQGIGPEDFVAIPPGFPFQFMGWLADCLKDAGGSVGN